MSLFLQETASDEEDMVKNLYLTFTLSNQIFGLDIASVTEIIGMQDITVLTDAPDYIKGIINLRGRIIPVIDGRLKLNMPEAGYNERTCIIIITIRGSLFGLIVDSVSEAITIEASDIVPPPDLSASKKISGIGKSADKIILLLDGSMLLKEDELFGIDRI